MLIFSRSLESALLGVNIGNEPYWEILGFRGKIKTIQVEDIEVDYTRGNNLLLVSQTNIPCASQHYFTFRIE